MEQDQMEQLAATFFEMIPLEDWQGQNADSIEQRLQQRVMELGRLVLEKQILPQRVTEIEPQVQEGTLRCPLCESPDQSHKRRVKLTLKSLFGGTD